MCFIDALPTETMDASGASELRQREVEDAQRTTGATEPILGRVDDNPTALETKYVMELRRSPTRAELRAEAAGQLKAVLVAKGYKRSTLSGLDRDELVDLALPLLDPDNAYFDDAPLPLGSNCWQQLVLRFLLVAGALSYVHALLGLSGWSSAGAYGAEALALGVRNYRIRKEKRARLRKRA